MIIWNNIVLVQVLIYLDCNTKLTHRLLNCQITDWSTNTPLQEVSMCDSKNVTDTMVRILSNPSRNVITETRCYCSIYITQNTEVEITPVQFNKTGGHNSCAQKVSRKRCPICNNAALW